jgi:hypothetical protein
VGALDPVGVLAQGPHVCNKTFIIPYYIDHEAQQVLIMLQGSDQGMDFFGGRSFPMGSESICAAHEFFMQTNGFFPYLDYKSFRYCLPNIFINRQRASVFFLELPFIGREAFRPDGALHHCGFVSVDDLLQRPFIWVNKDSAGIVTSSFVCSVLAALDCFNFTGAWSQTKIIPVPSALTDEVITEHDYTEYGPDVFTQILRTHGDSPIRISIFFCKTYESRHIREVLLKNYCGWGVYWGTLRNWSHDPINALAQKIQCNTRVLRRVWPRLMKAVYLNVNDRTKQSLVLFFQVPDDGVSQVDFFPREDDYRWVPIDQLSHAGCTVALRETISQTAPAEYLPLDPWVPFLLRCPFVRALIHH